MEQGAEVRFHDGPAIVIGTANNPSFLRVDLLAGTQRELKEAGTVTLTEAIMVHEDSRWRLSEPSLSAGAQSSHALIVCAVEQGRGDVSYHTEGRKKLQGEILRSPHRNGREERIFVLPQGTNVVFQRGEIKRRLRFDGTMVSVSKEGSRR